MSTLPDGYGPAATDPPEARYYCECGASFRWEPPEWAICCVCGRRLCIECPKELCEGCNRLVCEEHSATVDDLTLCRKCGEEEAKEL